MKQTVPVAKGQVYTVSITGLGTNGEGVGKYEGFTVFVPYALPEEEVKVRITLVKKQYAVGEVVDIVKPSPHRIEPRCEVYGTCGGCQLQHVTYEEQLKLKTQKVKDVIERLAKDNPDLVLPALGPKEPWYYRNKMQMPVGGQKNKPLMGFYGRGSHDIVDIDTCYIQQEANNELTRLCRELMVKTSTEPYNEQTGHGSIRHIIGRINRANDEWMLVIVSSTKSIPEEDVWVKTLTAAFPSLKSIVINHNPKKTNVIMGPKNRLLYGSEQITDYIGHFEFHISPHSFFQVNPEQTTVLYEKALEFANLTGEETVIDAYCGTGSISLFLAEKAKQVIGIEIVEPAILDARRNAKRNGYTNTEFIVADAAIEMPKLYKKGVEPDVIVVDPIRAGCKLEVLEAAAHMQPKRIVYVSCNPSSMARDIAILKEKGYTLVKVQPVDMFPQTAHCEAISLLTRSEATQ